MTIDLADIWGKLSLNISSTESKVGVRAALNGAWMDNWSEDFHSGDLTSIGRTASHACVRLYPEHARRMYQQVYEGMPVLSLYEPIKVAKRGETFYMSASPDIYSRGKLSLPRALDLLKKAGARNPNRKRVEATLARQDGYPYRISNEQ